MPIWTVDRNLPGSDPSASARREPMTFLSIIVRRRAGRDDTMASSDIASRPLRMMSAATIASSRMSMMDEIAIGRGWFQRLAMRVVRAFGERRRRGRIDAYHRQTARASHRRRAARRKFRHKLENGLFEFNYSHIFTTTVSLLADVLSVARIYLIH
jgi:hypothetical protein